MVKCLVKYKIPFYEKNDVRRIPAIEQGSNNSSWYNKPINIVQQSSLLDPFKTANTVYIMML